MPSLGVNPSEFQAYLFIAKESLGYPSVSFLWF